MEENNTNLDKKLILFFRTTIWHTLLLLGFYQLELLK